MLAFTFPGQGSQKPGMGEPWRDHESWELVAEASEACGRDVEHLLLDADAETLKQTRNSQLSTFVLSLVVLDAVERTGLQPALAAGHSLGEYTALTATGTLSFEDGVRLVAERGEAMQVAAEQQEGTMAAVLGLDDDQVDIACASVDADVWVANFNAPGQVVIAGSPDGVERAGAAARDLGAKRVMALPVGGAFHTPYMAPARDRLRKALEEVDFRGPNVPVVANVDARPHPDGADWQRLLGAQLISPVRWRATLHTLEDLGATTLVELGPGTVLTGMAKRTVKALATANVAGPDDVDGLLEVVADRGQSGGAAHEGEHLFMTERIVVSPAAGVFEPEPGVGEGVTVETGQVVGRVGDAEVRSPWRGALMRLLAAAGERVTPSQPVAWVRV